MRKFTLIELLVVVALIAILSSMLMPSLSKSRTRAREAVCLSNLRQQAVFAMMVADDNDDGLPYAAVSLGAGYDDPMQWKVETGRYSDSSIPDLSKPYTSHPQQIRSGIFKCPIAAGDAAFDGGYGWNYAWLGYTAASGPRVKSSSLDKPAETIMSGDGSDNTSNWWQFDYLYAKGAFIGIGNRHRQLRGIQAANADGSALFYKYVELMTDSNGISNYYYRASK